MELALAKERARVSNVAALKAADELRAEQAAHRRSEEKIDEMAVELKNAADRYELLNKEHEDKLADLSKALNATKEIRTELRDAWEELRQAGKIVAGGSYLLQTKFFDPKYAPLDGRWSPADAYADLAKSTADTASSSKIKVIRKWRSFSGRNSMLPLARWR